MESLEFLDLGELSDSERDELLSCLHYDNARIKLPWRNVDPDRIKDAPNLGSATGDQSHAKPCQEPPPSDSYPPQYYPTNHPTHYLNNHHGFAPPPNLNYIYHQGTAAYSPGVTTTGYFHTLPLTTNVSPTHVLCPTYVISMPTPVHAYPPAYPGYGPVTDGSLLPAYSPDEGQVQPGQCCSPPVEGEVLQVSEQESVPGYDATAAKEPDVNPGFSSFGQENDAPVLQEPNDNTSRNHVEAAETSDHVQNGNSDLANVTVVSANDVVHDNETKSNGVCGNGMPENVVNNKAPKNWASLFKSKNAGDSVQNGFGGGGYTSPDKVDAQQCPIKNPRKADFVDPVFYQLAEYFTEHTVVSRPVSVQPRGLVNRSNYCYINSILQALIACPPMYHLLQGIVKIMNRCEKAPDTLNKMCQFAREFSKTEGVKVSHRKSEKNARKDQGVHINCGQPFEASYMHKILNGKSSDSFLVEGRQEDAEEFLGALLNLLNDEMRELMKLVKTESISEIKEEPIDNENDQEWQVMRKRNKCSITRKTEFQRTPISDIFGGLLKSRIHKTGDQPTDNIQPFFTLQLNIEKARTVQEALEALVSKNLIEGVTCSKTNKEVEAWQQTTIEELPIILILHLKCFDYKVNGCTKIIKPVEFPIDLKIDPKLLSGNVGQQYKLFSVVYHDGQEATKGHYLTDVYHTGYGTWLRYDDAIVRPVPEEQVLKPQGTRVPYLLFYRHSVQR